MVDSTTSNKSAYVFNATYKTQGNLSIGIRTRIKCDCFTLEQYFRWLIALANTFSRVGYLLYPFGVGFALGYVNLPGCFYSDGRSKKSFSIWGIWMDKIGLHTS